MEGFERKEIALFDGAYFDALFKDIALAKNSIYVEVYLFDPDQLGELFAAKLIEAAERGVVIKILVDSVGSPSWGNALTQRLEQAGIETRIFHPFPIYLTHWPKAAHTPTSWWAKALHILLRFNSRNHRKMIMIDHNIVYVSSANISSCHLSKENGGQGWRDTTVRLENIDTTFLQNAFNRAWNPVPLRFRIQRVWRRERRIDSIFLLNYNWYQRRRNYRWLLHKIYKSTDKIWITSAYFIPDQRILKALKRAAKRKVDVRLLLTHVSDVPITTLVAATFYGSLLKSGVKIYEYLPSMLHAKSLIVDNWYCVGSTNLNSRSLFYDYEVDVSIQSTAVKDQLKQQFLIDLQQSRMISWVDIQYQSKIKRFLGYVLLIIRNII